MDQVTSTGGETDGPSNAVVEDAAATNSQSNEVGGLVNAILHYNLFFIISLLNFYQNGL